MLFVAVTNIIVDPLQIYRKQLVKPPVFWTEQRFQNAGKINSYVASGEYDSIIIGHSQLDNFRPSSIQHLLGWGPTLRLTSDGSTPYEQYITADYALKTRAVKNVLLGIGKNYLDNNPRIFNNGRVFPVFLYTETWVDDYPYWLGFDVFEFSLQLIFGVLDWTSDLDSLNYWMPAHLRSYVRFNSQESLRVLAHVLNKKNRVDATTELKSKQFINVSQNLTPLVEGHEEVNFILFFPPMHYVTLTNIDFYTKWMGLQKFVVEKTAGMNNVKVFGFDDCAFIGGNSANYRDKVHYHSGVNQYMLEAFRDDRHRLTLATFPEYEERVRRNVAEYQVWSDFSTMIPMALPEENAELQQYLQQQSPK